MITIINGVRLSQHILSYYVTRILYIHVSVISDVLWWPFACVTVC